MRNGRSRVIVRSYYIIFFTVAMLTVTGCMVKSPDDSIISKSLDDFMETSSKSHVKEKKIQFGINDDIKSKLKKAVWNDHATIAAQARLKESGASIIAVEGTLKPQLGLSVNAGVLREQLQSSTNDTVGAGANISLTQLLYDGGSTEARISIAQIAQIKAQTSFQEVASSVAFDAATALIDYRTSTARIDLLDGYLARGQVLTEQLSKLTSNGIINKSVYLSAQMELEDLSLGRLKLIETKKDSYERLSRFFMGVPKEFSELGSPIEGLSLSKLEGLWLSSPKVTAAAAEVLGAKQALDLAKAAMKPSVALSAGASSPMSEVGSTDFSLGVNINWTLGDGGQRKANIRSAEQRVIMLERNFSSTQDEVRRKIKSSLSQRLSLIQSLKQYRGQQTSAESQRDIAANQLSTGQVSIRQLVDTNIRAYRISDQVLVAETEQIILEYRLASSALRLLEWLSVDVKNAN